MATHTIKFVVSQETDPAISASFEASERGLWKLEDC